jgi:hypothetical protein
LWRALHAVPTQAAREHTASSAHVARRCESGWMAKRSVPRREAWSGSYLLLLWSRATKAWGAHRTAEAGRWRNVLSFLRRRLHAWWTTAAHEREVRDGLRGDAHVGQLAGNFARSVAALESCHGVLHACVASGEAVVLVAHVFLLLHLPNLKRSTLHFSTLNLATHHLMLMHAAGILHKAWW